MDNKQEKTYAGMTRHTLCLGAGGAAVVLGLDGLKYAGSQPLARPPERQEKMRAVDERRVRALTGKAGRAVALSYFTSTGLESAGKPKHKISRIRLKNGIRTCTIEPSLFLEQIA